MVSYLQREHPEKIAFDSEISNSSKILSKIPPIVAVHPNPFLLGTAAP
jgi:hypothetical protein